MNRTDALLDQALQLPPDEAIAFITASCDDDAALQARVLRLLRLARSAQVDDALGSLFGGATALALSAIAPASPQRVGAWRLGECLGSGGMAQVFRAERDDGTVAQAAAVKILWPHQLRPDYVTRFSREREILATLDDPRIARYLDGGVAEDGRPWLAIELVDGVPLDRHLQRRDLDLDARLDLFAQVAGAVASAHRQMVVHRDLKPANVLVRGDGSPRLLDFGIAALQSGGHDDALTRDYGRLLTPEFASPEQLAGARVDTRSDIHQLGTLLYLLLTGTHPQTRAPGADANMQNEPRPPSICLRAPREWPVRARALRGDLDAVVLKAIDRDPEARYASVEALLDDLHRARNGRPVLARDHGTLQRGVKWLRRHWAVSAIAATALVALLGFTAQTLRHAQDMAREARFNQDAAGFIENVLMRAGPSQALSEEVLANAAERARVDLADQPALRARMLGMLARLRLGRAEVDLGVGLAREALAAAQMADEPQRWRSIATLTAELLNYNGELAAAENLLREIVARDAASGRDEDSYVLVILADVLHSNGRWADALPIAQRAVALNPHGGISYCVLGMVLRDLARYDEARTILERGVAIGRARAVPETGVIATCLDCIGQTELFAGNVDAARAALEQSAALRTDRLGSAWAGMVWSHHWLGLAHHAAGDLAGADPLLSNTVAHYREHFSTGSHLLAYARNDLGWLRRAQGRTDEARVLFEQAAETLQHFGNGQHPRLAEPLMGLAVIEASRDREAARAFAERAWQVRHATLLRTHPGRIRACLLLRHLGGTCNDAGAHPSTALEWLRLQPLP